MRILLSKSSAALMLLAAVLGAAAGLPVAAPGAAGDGSPGSDPQVTVTADRLVSDRDARTATFTGRVKVVRGTSSVEADQLTVYYDENTTGTVAAPPGRSAIERIIAEGNVKIRSEDLTARTPKAIYSRPAQTIQLLGAGTRVFSGGNSITGTKFVLHMEGERLTVLGGADKRVKAVIEPTPQK